MQFAKALINWYNTHQRDLPWRHSTQAYEIWLSEIMLQQTQVKQALPYYLKFLKHFPTVHDLAKADEDQVLKLWQGLGYYSRARNLHFTAKDISKNYNGSFPTTYKNLLQLKGVGEYTAAAIASFAFNEPKAVVDGNVYRVLSRIFGIDTPINSTEGIKQFKIKANELLDRENPATYNQAIMEFGAIQCKPKQPNCLFCPFQHTCVAFQQSKIERLPVKLKKTKVKTRYFNYLILEDDNENVLLNKRNHKGIWQNLYEYILSDTAQQVEVFPINKFQHLPQVKSTDITLLNSKPIKHTLTHRKLFVHFWKAKLQEPFNRQLAEHYEIVKRDQLNNYAVPVLIENFIEEYVLRA